MKNPEVSARSYEKFCIIAERIDFLLATIKEETAGYSTHIHTLRHPYFIELVGMGDRIIPYLFKVMTQHGASWTHFLLLHEITKHNPVPKEDIGRFDHEILHWLQWYLHSDYYKNVINDVYYGLITNCDYEE